MKSKKILRINTTKELIHSNEFKKRYKSNPTAFTRNRKLYFPILMILLLQKSLKSLQLKLNELSLMLKQENVSNSAFTQARANLDYRAFIELNKKYVVEKRYK